MYFYHIIDKKGFFSYNVKVSKINDLINNLQFD